MCRGLFSAAFLLWRYRVYGLILHHCENNLLPPFRKGHRSPWALHHAG